MKNLLITLLLGLSALVFADGLEDYNTLLQTYVSEEGWVNYEAWKANPDDLAKLQGYIDMLAAFDTSTLTDEERIAFWINAYNASVIHEVLQRYPVDTIRPNTLGVIPERSFFTDEKHVVGGKTYNLDAIENNEVRTLGEPRIHFALNCASRSCPELLNEAYDARKLNGQLDRQGQEFINDVTRNEFDTATNTAKLSKIFDWFEGDFDSAGGVVTFLLKFAEGDAKTVLENPALKIQYLTYNWALNKQ
jgi:Protein of unknown function, DUF547